MNDDLRYIEQGIDINEFNENMSKRNLELEFQIIRVRDIYFNALSTYQKLTESPIHAALLREYHSELSKMNRYSSIIPCK